jgi:GT2 family glycosyltransferase
MAEALREPGVALVIPAHNAAATLGACLDAAVAIAATPASPLRRIVVVDDDSGDATREVAAARGVEVIASPRRGAAAARNAGWRAVGDSLVWFVDADCVPDAAALPRLLGHLDDPAVWACGGTYAIAPRATLLERLVHEEIKVRHDRMPEETDFLATFNVVYRRSALETLGGFDERYLKGQDAELAFRALAAGGRLRFERRSEVRHHHADRLGRYLAVQRAQGRWRVALHLEHRGRARNRYSGPLDHAAPPLALLVPASLPLAAWPWGWLAPATLALLLAILQVPMAVAMLRRSGSPGMLAFIPLGWLRAFARGLGLAEGLRDRLLRRGGIAAVRREASR